MQLRKYFRIIFNIKFNLNATEMGFVGDIEIKMKSEGRQKLISKNISGCRNILFQ